MTALWRSLTRSGHAPDPIRKAAAEAKRRVDLRKPPPEETPEPLDATSPDWEAERYKQHLQTDFHAFIQAAWHVVEPGRRFVDGWHIQAVCIHLQEIYNGIGQPTGLKNLLVNIPPGSSKSLLVNVFFPAWVWVTKPEWRALFSSYDINLSLRDSVKCRDLITSEWYQSTFQPEWKLKGDQNVKGHFSNTRAGFRMCVSIGGAGTGHRADSLFVDDPMKALDRHSEKARGTVKDWWDTTLSNRLSDMLTGSKVVIMQRLHDDDLSGHILSKYPEFLHLCIPMEFNPDKRCTTPYWTDPRTEFGQLMDPVRFPQKVNQSLKKALGAVDYAGQYQQQTAPTDGALYKRKDWRFWLPADYAHLITRTDLISYRNEQNEMVTPFVEILPYTLQELRTRPGLFQDLAQTWDAAFKDKQTSAYTSGQVWGRMGIKRYLLDEARGHWPIQLVCRHILRLATLWPHAVAKIIEDKANGPAIMQLLAGTVTGLIDVMPYGTKYARAAANIPSHEAGEWYAPHPAMPEYHWVSDYINEFTKFPGGYADRVDSAGQWHQRVTVNINTAPPEDDSDGSFIARG